jgi:hypothetical protein
MAPSSEADPEDRGNLDVRGVMELAQSRMGPEIEVIEEFRRFDLILP